MEYAVPYSYEYLRVLYEIIVISALPYPTVANHWIS